MLAPAVQAGFVNLETVRSIPGNPLRFATPEPSVEGFNPFLVLHERGRADSRPGPAVEIDKHPDRGYEIINYIVAAEGFGLVAQQHTRFGGADAASLLVVEEVNRSSKAMGIVHADATMLRPPQKIHETHGFQIWLRAPRDPMASARSQGYAEDSVPVFCMHGVWVLTLVGTFKGIQAPSVSEGSAFVAHVRLSARADVAFPIAQGATTLVYAMHGSAQLGPQAIAAGQTAMIHAKDYIAVGAGAEGFEGLVLSALPTAGDDSRRPPAIDELREAYATFRSGHYTRASTVTSAEIFRNSNGDLH